VGVKTIHDKINEIYQQTGSDVWKPAKLLSELAEQGKGFYR
jgi:3-hydroxyacyl-CoA dehydrogenase